MTTITDKLLDQLQDELREYARTLRHDARLSCEDDDSTLNKNLSWTLDELAGDRGLLVRFAFLLCSHSTRSSAIAAIVNVEVPV